MLFKSKAPSPPIPATKPEKSVTAYSLAYAQMAVQDIITRIDHFTVPKNEINEANTCEHFVLPFFRAFGWDSDFAYWSAQHHIEGTNRHVDYAFSTTGHGWAYIEAKRLRFKHIDQNHNFIKQIAGYFNAVKDAHLIILTNGEEYCFYSYGENVEIRTTPFIRFNIRHIDLTSNAAFLRHLFIQNFHISDWPKYAEMSRSLAEIRHSLRHAPDTLGKKDVTEKSFALLYPDMDEAERKEVIQFFTTFS